MTNVAFEECEIEHVTAQEPFDAVVSRFVLMYQADPVATLARLAGTVKKGGLLVVQEPDFGVGISTWPTVELWQKVSYWMRETFRRGGVHHDVGCKLYHLFRRAGLPGPMLLQHVTVGGGADTQPSCENSAEMIRSLLPRMEKFGIATAEEVQVDTLAQRLQREASAAEAQVAFVPITGAWATVGG